jgi:hypothetical protein
MPCGDCPGAVRRCVAGAWGECVAPAETCDGTDDDCDGATDEGFPGLGDPCEAGIGACHAVGHLACDAAGDAVACDAAPGEAVTETPNGIDDDCDGQIDEAAVAGDPCAVGVGACLRRGVLRADRDGTLICPVQRAAPVRELCNGVDDDCDGETDEAYDDSDGDGVADCMAADDDRDGVPDEQDDCPTVADPDQADADGDGIGDACAAVVGVQIAAQIGTACMLRGDGSPLCWGDGLPGEVQLPPGRYDRLAAGFEQTCAPAGGAAPACNGRDAPDGGPDGLRPDTLAMGRGFQCALLPTDDAACWGTDRTGVTSPPPGPFRALAAGEDHACGLRPDGTVTCWGHEEDARPWADEPGPFVAVSAGAHRTCALAADGSVRCHGGAGQLPEADYVQVAVGKGQLDGTAPVCGVTREGAVRCAPDDLLPGFTPDGPVTAVAVGGHFACAVRPRRPPFCWSRFQTLVSLPPGPHLVSLDPTGCVIRSDGHATCFGGDEGLDGRYVLARASSDHRRMCALRRNGSVDCLGWPDRAPSHAEGPFTELAVGTASAFGLGPEGATGVWPAGRGDPQVPGGHLQGLTVAGDTFGAIDDAGAIRLWHDSPSYSTAPPEGPFVRLVFGPADRACALRADGSAACWGGTWEAAGRPQLPPVVRDLDLDAANVCTLDGDGRPACTGHIAPDWPEGRYTRIRFMGLFVVALRDDGALLPNGNPHPLLPGTFRDFAGTCAERDDGTLVCLQDAEAFARGEAPMP